jgi:hypothetical protein
MDEIFREIDRLLEEMISQQREKVYEVAHEINPRLTQDDILDPSGFSELASNPRFNYEDGILAGLMSAQTAFRAYYKDKKYI